MKKLFCILFVFTLVACSSAPSADTVGTAIAETQAIQSTIEVGAAQTQAALAPTITNTSLPTNTPEATNTPEPTNTIVPSATAPPLPTDTEKPSTGIDKIAKNHIISQDSGGVTVEILRFLIADKSSVPQEFPEDIFDDKSVVGEIIFKVTNTTSGIINIKLLRGIVVLGSEQVNLHDYYLAGIWMDNDFREGVYPGVTTIGGIWFGLKNTTVADVSHVIIGLDAPTDKDYNDLGPDYYIEFDIEGWTFEAMPEELK